MPKRRGGGAERAKRLAQRREEYPRRVITFWKNTMRDRIARSMELVDFRPFRGDFHIHSTYSDGVGTVEENVEYGKAIGLDFMFITDHGTIRQKVNCKKYDDVWWGQEPGTQYHHLGILGLDRKYTPKRDLAYDYHRVRELGGYSFIPHPTGWFPSTRYTDEQKDALDLLGEEFAIEIINGANQVFDCYDVTDEMAIELWDRHLCGGKRVTGVGCTDAHLPHAVGDVWTGVLCDAPTKECVLDALKGGHCFTSDAPLVRIEVDGVGMGDTLRRSEGSVTLTFVCADSLGIGDIRVVKDGRTLQQINGEGRTKVEGEIADRFEGERSYYRLECLARDRRRAYTNPVYVR